MKTVALLIDGDNAQLNYTKQIIQFCEVFGTLRIKNAYGDWQQLPLSLRRQTITDLGIDCIQQDRVTKNATDFALAMDAASMLDKGEVDTYFIVSNDNHFTAVCERIHQKRAKVYGIGSKKHKSDELRSACAEFFDIEDIVNIHSESLTKSPAPVAKTAPKAKIVPVLKVTTAPKAKTVPKTPPTPKAKATPAPKAKITTAPKTPPAPTSKIATKLSPEATTMLNFLIQAHQKTPQKDGWVLLSQLREVLRKLDNQFDTRFANKRLSTWFKGFPHKFEVEGNRVRLK